MALFGTKYDFQIKEIHEKLDNLVGVYDDDTVDTIRNFVIASINEIQKIEKIEKVLNDSVVELTTTQTAAKKFIKDMNKAATEQPDKNFVNKLMKNYAEVNGDILRETEALSRLYYMKEILHENIDIICSNATEIDNETKNVFFEGYTRSLFANYKILNDLVKSKAIVALRPQDDADQYFRESQKIAKELFDKSIDFPEHQHYKFDDEEKTEVQEVKKAQESIKKHPVDKEYDPMLG